MNRCLVFGHQWSRYGPGRSVCSRCKMVRTIEADGHRTYSRPKRSWWRVWRER